MKRGVVGESAIIRWHDTKAEKISLKDMRKLRDFEFTDKARGALLASYLCTNCGYVEFFVPTAYRPQPIETETE